MYVSVDWNIASNPDFQLDPSHPIDFKSISNLGEVYWKYSQQYCISFLRCSYLSSLKPGSMYWESIYFPVLFNFSRFWRSIDFSFSPTLEKHEKVQNERMNNMYVNRLTIDKYTYHILSISKYRNGLKIL